MTKFDIFVVNLKRSADRREAMREKIARIRGFKAIYIDGELVCEKNSSLGAPCGDFGNLERFADAPVQSHAPNSQKTPQFPPQILELDSSKSDSSESSLRGESMDSPKQSKQNNRASAHQISPDSWCKKSESKGAVVPPADFLLESEKRGSPPKSEKAAAFWRVGGAGRGVQPFLRKETSESSANSVDCFGDESPRNDGVVKLPQDEFAEFALHFHFFPATDATKFKNGESPLPPQYSSKLTRFVKGKDLSFGEIAIFSSSYRLWQKCVELDSPIIVLEDDIDFMQDFCQIVEIFKSPFEYVRLRYTIDKKITHLYDRFYISFDRIAGAQGYYLTPQAAQKFIKNARFWLFCVDDYMDMFFIHSVQNIIFKPFIISEDSLSAGTSTILGREKPKMRFYQKLTRELSRIYFFVIRKYVYFALHFVEIRAFFRANRR